MDIVCFSHLRWNFVYHRPQHLISRLAKIFRVFFIEEPVFDTPKAYLYKEQNKEKVWIIVPHLSQGLTEIQVNQEIAQLLKILFHNFVIDQYTFWYYTPMALEFSRDFTPTAIVYDCMDELSAFQNASPRLHVLEPELFQKADVVFTGGESLFELKKSSHSNIHLFPSSIDRLHFGKARKISANLPDQIDIPSPRIGFFGVVDERMDISLLNEVAVLRPDWHFVIIGPVVKISPGILPRLPNIHFLGPKTYELLPDYISGWDVAIMPFAINKSTRYISPTKTPEYLAAGKPVVSTAIHDVVKTYGNAGLVYIAETPQECIMSIDSALTLDKSIWLQVVDNVLSENSWDNTFEKMLALLNKVLEKNKDLLSTTKNEEYV